MAGRRTSCRGLVGGGLVVEPVVLEGLTRRDSADVERVASWWSLALWALGMAGAVLGAAVTGSLLAWVLALVPPLAWLATWVRDMAGQR